MSKKHRPTNKAAEQPMADKLRLINGIGPAVEERLNRVGIFTFAQLATLSPADIAAAVAGLAGLSAERIIKQDWIGQAHKLAAKSILADSQVDVKAPIEEHVSEATPSVESEKIAAASPAIPEAEPPDHMPTVTTESELLTSITESSRLAGTLRLLEIELIRSESNSPSRLLPSDKPFDVRLTLDLADLQVPDNTALNYKASIYGKGRGTGSYSGLAGEVQGTIIPGDLVTINVEGNTLPDGIYQLTAIVILDLPDMKLTPKSGTTAMIDGGQVQFY
jgi:hypothetical protein